MNDKNTIWTHKLIVFSDLHFTAGDKPIIGLEPSRRTAALLAQAAQRHPDAEALILLGDLADTAEPEAYRDLHAILADVPWPVIPMIGNHDQREPFQAVFTDAPRTPDGHVMGAHDFGDWRVLTLDTLHGPPYPPEYHAGTLCDARLQWIAAQVKSAADRPLLVCFHHPPFDTGIVGLDPIRLTTGGDAVVDLLATHGSAYMLCGHIHRTISGAVQGVPFSMVKSPCHQGLLDMINIDSSLSGKDAPGYGVVLLTPAGVVVHGEDLDEGVDVDQSYFPD